MIVFPIPSLLSPPVLAELQQADLISSEECRGLDDSRGVVEIQRGKSFEVQSKTADVLKRHGFEKESTHLSGKQLSTIRMKDPVVGHFCFPLSVWDVVCPSSPLFMVTAGLTC